MFTSRPALRWIAPLAVLALVLAAGAAGTQLGASAAGALPPRSAKQLLVDLQSARPKAFSGTVVQRADLGLPQLPSVTTGEGSSELSSLVSGNHTLKIWYDSPQRVRLALLGTLGESDVIRNGRDLWTWSSQSNSATHRRLPAQDKGAGPDSGAAAPGEGPDGRQLPTTPQEAADRALAALDPSTRVTTDGTARVAGRDAYQLVLTPRGSDSLVGQVRLAIDARTHLPLQVQAYARDASEPAFQVGFTRISYGTPSAEHFAFDPPPGAKVAPARPDRRGAPDRPEKPGATTATPDEPRVIGAGWTGVVVVEAPVAKGPTGPADANKPRGDSLGAVLTSLPKVSGSWGSGRLLESSLFTVLVTDDGRVLAGAVRPNRLFSVAGAAR